jgi:2,4-dienoyl-CoA reductase-like NADH-dependent reductase (Old Yellow Enzyme family)
MLFTDYQNGHLNLKNRVVRSATADPEIFINNCIKDVTVKRYEDLAKANVAMIITGDFPVTSQDMLTTSAENWKNYDYSPLRVHGIKKLVERVRLKSKQVTFIAQLSTGFIMRIPSDYNSPFGDLGMEVLTIAECKAIVKSFAETAKEFQNSGFDGVQIHAAHGGPLSLFLSPLTNTRDDQYGDPTQLFKEIRDEVKKSCGDFPVLIKMNCTDYMPNGLTKEAFHRIATGLAEAGYDGIEVSGGIWDCLNRSEESLGFPPQPSAEAHTKLSSPEKQSYFRSWIKDLILPIPIILVGGNRNKNICNEILSSGDADLISFCRPFISGTDFIKSWESSSENNTNCINCNACLYELYEIPNGFATPIRCVYKEDKTEFKKGVRWGREWVEKNFP